MVGWELGVSWVLVGWELEKKVNLLRYYLLSSVDIMSDAEFEILETYEIFPLGFSEKYDVRFQKVKVCKEDDEDTVNYDLRKYYDGHPTKQGIMIYNLEMLEDVSDEIHNAILEER